MNLTAKNGKMVEVNFDSKQQVATVGGRVIAGVRNNVAKIWNSDILTHESNVQVKAEITRQFTKKVDNVKKK